MALCFPQASRQSLQPLDISKERSCEILHQLATLVFKSPLPALNEVFKELNMAKVIDILLSKIFKEVLKIGDDFVSIIASKVHL